MLIADYKLLIIKNCGKVLGNLYSGFDHQAPDCFFLPGNLKIFQKFIIVDFGGEFAQRMAAKFLVLQLLSLRCLPPDKVCLFF